MPARTLRSEMPAVANGTVFSQWQAQQLWRTQRRMEQQEAEEGGEEYVPGQPWVMHNYNGTAAAKMMGGVLAGSAGSDMHQLSPAALVCAFMGAGLKVRSVPPGIPCWHAAMRPCVACYSHASCWRHAAQLLSPVGQCPWLGPASDC